MLTFLSLHASSCKKQIILLKPTNKRVVKCKGNILSNQMWGKSCSRNVLYHSYPKLTPVTQSRSHILRNKKIWIPDRLVKNRTYNGVFDSFVFSLRFTVKGHYNRFSANQIWTDSNSRFVELLNFCITFVLPTLTWKFWEFRAFEPLNFCDDLIDYAICSNTLSDLLDERSVSFFRRRPSYDIILLTLSHRAWSDDPERKLSQF